MLSSIQLIYLFLFCDVCRPQRHRATMAYGVNTHFHTITPPLTLRGRRNETRFWFRTWSIKKLKHAGRIKWNNQAKCNDEDKLKWRDQTTCARVTDGYLCTRDTKSLLTEWLQICAAQEGEFLQTCAMTRWDKVYQPKADQCGTTVRGCRDVPRQRAHIQRRKRNNWATGHTVMQECPLHAAGKHCCPVHQHILHLRSLMYVLHLSTASGYHAIVI